MGEIIPKLRASARGQECTLRVEGVCNHDPDTTVLAHLPSPIKGCGTKGNDWHAVFACSACHDALDQRNLRSFEARYCLQGLEETQRFWIENGYLVIPGVLTKQPKPSKKTVPRTSLFARQP